VTANLARWRRKHFLQRSFCFWTNWLSRIDNEEKSTLKEKMEEDDTTWETVIQNAIFFQDRISSINFEKCLTWWRATSTTIVPDHDAGHCCRGSSSKEVGKKCEDNQVYIPSSNFSSRRTICSIFNPNFLNSKFAIRIMKYCYVLSSSRRRKMFSGSFCWKKNILAARFHLYSSVYFTL
jgi:hypothetical protein